MKILLKLCNPVIAVMNFLDYQAHLEAHRFAKTYTPYPASRKIAYF